MLRLRRRDPTMDDAENEPDHRDEGQHEGEVAAEGRPDPGGGLRGHDPREHALGLRLQAAMRLAQVAAAGVEGAAERADRPGIGRVMGHVLALERMLADGALDLRAPAPFGGSGPGEVVPAAGGVGDGGCGGEGCDEGEQRREVLEPAPKQTHISEGAHHQRQRGRSGADRVHGVEMRALELDPRRRQAEGLVDGQIRRERADPSRDHHRIERERAGEGLVDAEFHQQQRDGDVEDEPDHAAGMAVGQAREKIRPGDGAGIGVGDVDLELRDHHEQAGEEDRPLPATASRSRRRPHTSASARPPDRRARPAPGRAPPGRRRA